jgi:NAD(P)-dependent dehydrogenase (short-subunit alcohol dehydrogenase family)
MERLGRPEEMADLIVYLMSPAASYITAQVFNCDGGHAQSMFFVPMGT